MPFNVNLGRGNHGYDAARAIGTGTNGGNLINLFTTNTRFSPEGTSATSPAYLLNAMGFANGVIQQIHSHNLQTTVLANTLTGRSREQLERLIPASTPNRAALINRILSNQPNQLLNLDRSPLRVPIDARLDPARPNYVDNPNTLSASELAAIFRQAPNTTAAQATANAVSFLSMVDHNQDSQIDAAELGRFFAASDNPNQVLNHMRSRARTTGTSGGSTETQRKTAYYQLVRRLAENGSLGANWRVNENRLQYNLPNETGGGRTWTTVDANTLANDTYTSDEHRPQIPESSADGNLTIHERFLALRAAMGYTGSHGLTGSLMLRVNNDGSLVTSSGNPQQRFTSTQLRTALGLGTTGANRNITGLWGNYSRTQIPGLFGLNAGINYFNYNDMRARSGLLGSFYPTRGQMGVQFSNVADPQTIPEAEGDARTAAITAQTNYRNNAFAMATVENRFYDGIEMNAQGQITNRVATAADYNNATTRARITRIIINGRAYNIVRNAPGGGQAGLNENEVRYYLYANSGGRLTGNTLNTYTNQFRAAIDADGNGTISAAEQAAYMVYQDANHDGTVSTAEAATAFGRIIGTAATNETRTTVNTALDAILASRPGGGTTPTFANLYTAFYGDSTNPAAGTLLAEMRRDPNHPGGSGGS